MEILSLTKQSSSYLNARKFSLGSPSVKILIYVIGKLFAVFFLQIRHKKKFN